MEFKDYLTMAVAVTAIITAFAGSMRWMVKHYLNELRPNGGSSIKDSISRLEIRVDDLFKLIAEKD
jgi:hypothetical protein